MTKLQGRLESLDFVRQPIKKKEQFQFNPLKIDFGSHTARDEAV